VLVSRAQTQIGEIINQGNQGGDQGEETGQKQGEKQEKGY
jgi:hypothetical protein